MSGKSGTGLEMSESETDSAMARLLPGGGEASAAGGSAHAARSKRVNVLEDEEDPFPAPAPRIRQWRSVLEDGWSVYLKRSFSAMLLESAFSVLLIALPLLLIFVLALPSNDALLLIMALVALCPLAERMSYVTEELSKYTNDMMCGLLSATMGNIAELIVAIFAIGNGLIRVVQLSLLGSILANALLVLGCAFAVVSTLAQRRTTLCVCVLSDSNRSSHPLFSLLFCMRVSGRPPCADDALQQECDCCERWRVVHRHAGSGAADAAACIQRHLNT
jgi:hypothetical protein